MSFYTGVPTEVLYSLAAGPVTKNTYTTQAILSAPAATQAVAIVPANYFGAAPNGLSRAVWLHAEGTMATTSAATLQMVLLWDPTPGTIGTTLATPWPTLAPTASITATWRLDAFIQPTQAGSAAGLTLTCAGEMKVSVVAAGTLSTAPQSIMFNTSTSGLTADAQAAIELAGTWSVSAAGNTTTVSEMFLFGMN